MPVLTLVPATADNPTLDTGVGPTELFAASLRREGLSEATVSAYLSDLNRYGVGLPSAFVNPDAHADLAARIVNEDAPPSTRLRRLASLGRFYRYISPDATENPYRTVRRPSSGVVLPDAVPEPDESRSLIAALSAEGTTAGRRDAAALALMAGAGLRVGEVCSLTARNLDPQSCTLLFEGKGRKTRQVPISEFVMNTLMTYLSTDVGIRLSGDTRLFPVTPRTLQRAVKRAAQAAGADMRLHPHSLRHGFGTAVQAQHKDLRLLADLLGHSSVTTTAIYTHTSDARRIEAVESAL